MPIGRSAQGRVLWAEDQQTDRYLIQAALDDLPRRPDVQFVQDGQELLDVMARAVPASIVLDLTMPRMSGQEALRRLRADPAFARLPVSVFTGLHDPRVEAQCRALGVDDYVLKPLDLQGFSEGVGQVLRIPTNR